MRDTPEVRRWIAALRDRSFAQGNDVLAQRPLDADDSVGRRYCCLGVLAELNHGLEVSHSDQYTRQGRRVWQVKTSIAGDGLRYTCWLPPRLSEPLGLNAHDQDPLITMNDSYGFSFEQIADVLELSLDEFDGDNTRALDDYLKRNAS